MRREEEEARGVCAHHRPLHHLCPCLLYTSSVKIVKLMTFGAFAEVVPGVDGLIHISQIADRRIEKPGDVLTEGEMVDAKITAIDEEKQKILSLIHICWRSCPSCRAWRRTVSCGWTRRRRRPDVYKRQS